MSSCGHLPFPYLGPKLDQRIPWLIRRRLLDGVQTRSREDMSVMELPSAFIRYRMRGERGPTLVMVPDPPAVLEHYDRLLELMSPNQRTVVFETPACGFSVPKPGFDFQFEPWVLTLLGFLERLDAGPYVLAFPCVSSFAAIAIALRAPHLVEGLILPQAAGWGELRRWVLSRSRFGMLTVPIYGQVLLYALKRRRASGMFRHLARKHVEELVEKADISFAQGALFPFATATQKYLTARPPGFMTPLRIPARVVWGAADPSHREIGTDPGSARRLVPDAEISVFEEAGHFPELEEPELYAAVVRDFYRSLRPGVPLPDEPISVAR